jgi:hypothetical protein
MDPRGDNFFTLLFSEITLSEFTDLRKKIKILDRREMLRVYDMFKEN